MKLKKVSKILYLILIIGVISIGIVIFLQNKLPAQKPSPTLSPTSTESQTTTEPYIQTATTTQNQIDISKWETYRNEKFGYSFKYPPNLWEVHEAVCLSQCLDNKEVLATFLLPQKQSLHHPEDPHKIITISYNPQLEIRVLNENIMKPYINDVLKQKPVGTLQIGEKLYNVYEVGGYYRHDNVYYSVPHDCILIQHKGNTIEILYHTHAKELIKPLLDTFIIE